MVAVVQGVERRYVVDMYYEKRTLYWSVPCPLQYEYLKGLDISNNHVGVYIIWDVDPIGVRVLDVGQGVIQDRLARHLHDNPGWEVEAKFTWAPVPHAWDRDGIEAFLADHYELRGRGGRYPDVMPIIVNRPFLSSG